MIMSSSFNSIEKKRSNSNAFSILLSNHGNNIKKKKFKKNIDNKSKTNIIHERKYGKCPICSASIPLIALQEHVNNVHFKPSTGKKKIEMKKTGNKTDKKPPVGITQQNSIRLCATSNANNSVSKKYNNNNAFNTLMENAKKKRRSEIFYLKFGNNFNDLCQTEDIKYKCVWLEKNDKIYTSLKNESLSSESSSSISSSLNFSIPKCNFRDPTLTKDGIFLLETNMQSSTKFSPTTYCNRSISISVIKSSLQKNIRRCRPEHAVRCALQLINLSFTDFIRRMVSLPNFLYDVYAFFYT